MNILAIGNSFSVDATTYLHDMAKCSGEYLTVANLYIGGCSVERHFRNYYSDERAYELQYNGDLTGFKVSLKEALLNRAWDVITIQQASHFSAHFDTYVPYIDTLAEAIRRLCPKAKLVIHQTWAYEEASEKLFNVAHFESADAMFENIENAYKRVAERIGADGIIPSGKVMFALSKAGIGPVHRDTFHASFGVGRYALALTWLRALTGVDVSSNTFSATSVPLTEEQVTAAKSIVSTINPIF